MIKYEIMKRKPHSKSDNEKLQTTTIQESVSDSNINVEARTQIEDEQFPALTRENLSIPSVRQHIQLQASWLPSAPDSDTGGSRKKKKKKTQLKASTDTELPSNVQVSKKPKKSKVVMLSDLFDKLKPGQTKISNSRAVERIVSEKLSLQSLQKLMKQLISNGGEKPFIIPATDSKLKNVKAVSKVYELFLKVGFVLSKAGAAELKEYNDEKVQDIVKVVDVQLSQLKSRKANDVNPGTDPLLHGRRGKERLVPKKKKPTKLKRIVTADQEMMQTKGIRKLLKMVKAKPQDQILTSSDIFDFKVALWEARVRCLLPKSPTLTWNVVYNELELIHQTKVKTETDACSTSGSTSSSSNSPRSSPDSDNSDVEVDPKVLENMPALPKGGFGIHRLGHLIDVRTSSINQPPTQRPLIREYCKSMLTDEVDKICSSLLTQLSEYQRRALSEPQKFATRKRYVVGLRQSIKGLLAKRVKMVLLAPNIEKSTSEGGLDYLVNEVIHLCHSHSIPVVFCLRRRKLGLLVGIRQGASLVAIYNADGAHQEFKQLVAASKKAQEDYEVLVSNSEELLKQPRISWPSNQEKKESSLTSNKMNTDGQAGLTTSPPNENTPTTILNTNEITQPQRTSVLCTETTKRKNKKKAPRNTQSISLVAAQSQKLQISNNSLVGSNYSFSPIPNQQPFSTNPAWTNQLFTHYPYSLPQMEYYNQHSTSPIYASDQYAHAYPNRYYPL